MNGRIKTYDGAELCIGIKLTHQPYSKNGCFDDFDQEIEGIYLRVINVFLGRIWVWCGTKDVVIGRMYR